MTGENTIKTRLTNVISNLSTGGKTEQYWALGMALYLFLLPWQARYLFAEYSLQMPFYGGLSVYVTDILFVILLAIWIWHVCTVPSLRNMLKNRPRFLGVLGIFFAFAAISLFWAPDVFIGGMKVLRILQAGALLLMITFSNIPLRLIFLSLISSAAVQGLFAVQQFFLQYVPANTWMGIAAQDPRELGVSVIEHGQRRWLRAHGTLPHPNMLGAFLALGSLLSAGWFLSIYHNLEKWLDSVKQARIQIGASVFAFSICFLGLLFSFSRAAWLAFAVGFGVLVLTLIRKTNWRQILIPSGKLVVLGILLFSFVNLVFGPLWLERVQGGSRLAEKSVSERVDLRAEAEEIINEHPARGLGIGQYVIELMERNPDQPVYTYQPVHNTWLLLWAELGIVGLFPFVGAVAFMYIWASGMMARTRFSPNEAIIFSTVIAGILMLYFEHFWWTLTFGLLLAAVLAGLAVRRKYEVEVFHGG